MLTTFILEDNAKQRFYYQQIVRTQIMIDQLDMQLALVTATPQKIKHYLQHQPHTHGLFLLDIEIGNQLTAGLDLAEWIRNHFVDARIIFLTTHTEMAFLTFERKIAPLDYLLKDNGAPKVEQQLRQDLKIAQQRFQQTILHTKQKFGYRIGQRYYEIPFSQFYFLETVPGNTGKLIIHADHQQAEFIGRLSEQAEKYPHLFLAHRSILLNPQTITSFDAAKRIAYFPDQQKCVVAFRKVGALNRQLR